MTTKFLIGLIAVLLLSTGEVMSAKTTLRVVASISGDHLRAIQLALPEVSNRKLEVARYEISVLETAASFVILFESPKRQQGERGNLSGDQPALEVEIDRKTNKVIRSNYVR